MLLQLIVNNIAQFTSPAILVDGENLSMLMLLCEETKGLFTYNHSYGWVKITLQTSSHCGGNSKRIILFRFQLGKNAYVRIQGY